MKERDDAKQILEELMKQLETLQLDSISLTQKQKEREDAEKERDRQNAIANAEKLERDKNMIKNKRENLYT